MRYTFQNQADHLGLPNGAPLFILTF